jgi:long-chain acyl-CoA synthetase
MMAEGSRPSGDDTFPKLLFRNAELRGTRPAMRQKDFGIWQTWTWAEVLDEVRAFAIGLAEIGVKRNDRVAIIGQNRPRLYWAIAASQSLGAVPVPLYADSVAAEMAYVLEHAGIGAAIVQNQEQVDKLLSVSDRLPGLRRLVYDETRGMRDYDHAHLSAFEDVQAAGRRALARGADTEARWLAAVEEGRGSDLAIILYTSGTTGRPKGVMLSFDNLIVSARNANAFDALGEDEETLAYLPMAWVGDHIFSYAQSYTAGYCVNCPESPDTIVQDRREIGPTYFFAPPRVFEALLTLITVRMEDAGRAKRAMFRFFMDVAKRAGEKILDGERVRLVDRLLYAVGRMLVYGPVANRLGFSRLKVGYTAGEAIGPEIFRFYRSLGINLKQLYGQTEASVYITMQPDGEIGAETVGKPALGVELKIAEDGEVIYRSPGVFLGYYRQEEATRAVKTADGWVRTGDAGFIDGSGNLKILDRAKDVGRLADGSLFAPKYIENKLKFFPEIREAVVFGDRRDMVAAFINIDPVAVGSWAERNDVSYGSYQELAAHPEVARIVAARVAQVNDDLAREAAMAGCQVRRFLILHKELDADDGELTRTLKVRRNSIMERYGELIQALYDPAVCEARAETEVTFEDGRKGWISATLAIHDMDMPAGRRMLAEAAE